MEAVVRLAQHVRQEMGKVVVGQEELKTQCLIAHLSQGHALLEGVPGIAKTLAIKVLSRILGLDFQRVQCTSDLMPADIVGTKILNMSTSTFQLHRGPVFTNLLLVDEVNRMPPRTQAALLECMQERQVTIDGERHVLSPNFTVFATQNPVDFEGTYPLPEAQLDRFLVKIRVPYPEAKEEIQLLAASQLMRDQKRRSLVVWITDLAETAMTPEVIEAVAKLMPRHLVLFVVIGQPDLRMAASQRPKNVSEMYQVSAAQEVIHRRELLLARLRERGALAVEADSGELAPLLVNSYLAIKQKSQL
jgi:MoxR-like ATPase